MRPGSQFLRQLDDAGIPDDVQAYTIRTHFETRVWPPRSAVLDGAHDFHVPFTTHPGLLRNRTVLQRIIDCLDHPITG
jgi:hypothetical protein